MADRRARVFAVARRVLPEDVNCSCRYPAEQFTGASFSSNVFGPRALGTSAHIETD
jgi:hypothetical protein